MKGETSSSPRRGGPPVLLLDVMGTLVYDPFYVEVPAFFGMSLEELLEQKHPTAWTELEAGEIDDRTHFARYFADGRRFDGAALKACMAGAYRWLDGMQELLSDLRDRGHAMHAFSNYPDWYLLIEERLGLSRFLEWSFVSCHTGLRKPDPAAYRHAAYELEVPAHACVFVDDREVNCRVARELGMDAIRFRDAASLRRELEGRGLLGGPGRP